MTETQMLAEIRSVVAQFKTRHRAALYLGVSDSYLTDVIKGRRTLGLTIPRKLGYVRLVTYKRG